MVSQGDSFKELCTLYHTATDPHPPAKNGGGDDIVTLPYHSPPPTVPLLDTLPPLCYTPLMCLTCYHEYGSPSIMNPQVLATIRAIRLVYFYHPSGGACHIVLDEDPMSRHHAKVLYLDYQPEILDLGSTNGTYLNGKKVNRAFLKHGDQIQVGSSIFEALIGKEHMSAQPGAEGREEAKRVHIAHGDLRERL